MAGKLCTESDIHRAPPGVMGEGVARVIIAAINAIGIIVSSRKQNIIKHTKIKMRRSPKA